MKVILFLVPQVILLAARLDDHHVDQQRCKLSDQLLYSRVDVYKDRLCYFTIAKETAKLSQVPDEFRFREGQEACEKHNKAHLLRIRTKEEAEFVLQEFSFLDDFLLKSGAVKKLILGLIPHYSGGYKWDDNTNLTFRPEEWNGYHTARTRGSRYVFMHTQNMIDKDTVIWTSEELNIDFVNVSAPVGLVCQLEIEMATTTNADAAVNSPVAATTHGSAGVIHQSAWVMILAPFGIMIAFGLLSYSF